jgi:transposase
MKKGGTVKPAAGNANPSYDARSSAPWLPNEILEWIRQPYDIEDREREWSAGERLALRQRESVPILDRIEAKLDELTGRVLPKSALGKAVTSARNEWAALRRYTSDGRLTIENASDLRSSELDGVEFDSPRSCWKC